MWSIKNIITGQTAGNTSARSFEDLCRNIDEEILSDIDNIIRVGNKKTIKDHIKRIKEHNQILVFDNVCYDRHPMINHLFGHTLDQN